jgi:hypothetical protein
MFDTGKTHFPLGGLFLFAVLWFGIMLATGCAGRTPIQKAAEAYGYVVIATEAAADIVDDDNVPVDARKAIQLAERYSTPAAQLLKAAAVSAIKIEAAVSAGIATKAELDAAYELVLQRLADLQAPATDLFEAIGGK